MVAVLPEESCLKTLWPESTTAKLTPGENVWVLSLQPFEFRTEISPGYFFLRGGAEEALCFPWIVFGLLSGQCL